MLCKCSSGTSAGRTPDIAGQKIPHINPKLIFTISKTISGTSPVAKNATCTKSPAEATKSAKATALMRPNLSANTPPNGLIINIATVVDPRTSPNIFASPFGRFKIPKARAIGDIPFPKLLIKRAK